MIAKNYRFILTFTLVFALLVIVLPVSVAASPQADPVINKVYITNVRDNNFTVSWTTDIASDGVVWYGTDTPSTSISDTVASTTTHYVTITSLSPGTTYKFYVQSGVTIDNNGGTNYQVTLGPSLTPPTPGKQVWGFMYESNGTTLVQNGIVYLQLFDNDGAGSSGASQLFSARTEANGVWSFDLANVRTADFQLYYVFTSGADNLKIIGQGGTKGTRGVDPSPWVVPIPASFPTQYDVVLNQDPTAVTLLDLRATNAMPVAIPLVVSFGLVGVLVVAGLAWRK